MDKQQLDNLLTHIKPTTESIKNTARYCSSYPAVSNEIAGVIEETFKQVRKDRKKIYLFLIHEIILEEKSRVKQQNQDLPYIKAFGNRLKGLFQEFVASTDDFSELEKVQSIIKKWENEQIYHPSFLDKLKLIIKPKYDILKQQADTFNSMNQKDSNVQKMLKTNIKTVQENQYSNQVYQYLLQQWRVDEDVLKFSSEYDKMNLTELDEQTIQLLIDRGEHCVNDLKEAIQKNHSLQLEVGNKVELVLEEYNNFSLDEVMKQKEIGKEIFMKL